LFAGKTQNQLGAVRDIVILNAAGGVVAYRAAKDPDLVTMSLRAQFEPALELVTQALDSGAAADKLEAWVASSQR
jgi:anthranilate phosphoribosyltransferase